MWSIGKNFEQKIYRTQNGPVLLLSIPPFWESKSLVLLKTKENSESIPEVQLVSFQVPFQKTFCSNFPTTANHENLVEFEIKFRKNNKIKNEQTSRSDSVDSDKKITGYDLSRKKGENSKTNHWAKFQIESGSKL